MLDLYIAIANIVFFFGLLGVYLVRSAIVGRRRHARADADGGSVFLNKRTMEMVYWILDPIIDFLAALRITPASPIQPRGCSSCSSASPKQRRWEFSASWQAR